MNAVTSSHTPANATSNKLNKVLWVVQTLLAVLFLGAGMMKVTTPAAEIMAQDGMAWASRVPAWLITFIGASEVAGGLGLLLPSLTRILPRLTGVAAAALTLVMVLAAGEHAMAGEYAAIGFNALLGGLTALVAWGRLKAAPIAPRA